jgi:hypothetical protein
MRFVRTFLFHTRQLFRNRVTRPAKCFGDAVLQDITGDVPLRDPRNFAGDNAVFD